MELHHRFLRNIYFSLWITGTVFLITYYSTETGQIKHVTYPTPHLRISNRTNLNDNDNDTQSQTTFASTTTEPPVITPPPVFQRLEENIFIMAAFYDSRQTPEVIRVLSAAILGADHGELTCKLFHEQTKVAIHIPGTLNRFGDGDMHNKNSYQPSWITCPISLHLNGSSSFHEGLVIESSKERAPTNFLPIAFDGTPKYKVAACIQPLFTFEYPLELLEWIEFHKLLGVEHFSFYNMSIGPKSSDILNFYVRKGEVTVYQWDLPFPPNHIKNNGQILQINHCLYSYIGKAEMVFSHDVDEFVVPGVNTLGNFTNYYEFFSPMFNIPTPNKGKQVAMIKYPSRFAFEHFPKILPKIGNSLASSLKFTSRVSTVSSTGFIYRDKWIAKPQLLIESEVHFPTTLPTNATSMWIPDNIAHFIHYRTCTDKYMRDYCRSDNCPQRKCDELPPPEIHAEYALVFGKRLVARVLDKFDEIMKYEYEAEKL